LKGVKMLPLFLTATLSFAHAAEEVPSTAWPVLSIDNNGDTSPADAALLISIQDYAYVSPVRGAIANASDWQTYLSKTQGIPASNIQWLQDGEATREKIREAALQTSDKVKDGGTLWLVFIGHGAPSVDGTDGMLVGADAQQDPESLYSRSVSQNWLLSTLENGRQEQTIAIIDACFSGRTDSGALAEGLQPLIATKDIYTGKSMVLSAGKHDQFAGPLPATLPYADRPAFSYLALGGLLGWADMDGDRQITAKEVTQYADQTLETTLVGRAQNPQVRGENPEGVVLGLGTQKGPDLGEIQRLSKEINVKRQELIQAGMLDAPKRVITRNAVISYSATGALLIGAGVLNVMARNANQNAESAAVSDLDQYDEYVKEKNTYVSTSIALGATGVATLGLGVFFMF
jgi:hypothetical protein